MKFLIVIFVAIFGTCAAQNDLMSDLEDFNGLIPIEEVNEITNRYLQNEEFLSVVLYVLYDPGFKQIVIDLESLKEFLDVAVYIEDSGYLMYDYLDTLNGALGIPPMTRPTKLRKVADGEKAANIVNQCRDEVRAVLPKEDITKLHNLKLAESPAFKYFAERLATEELSGLIQDLFASPVYQRVYAEAMSNGLDLVDNVYFDLQLYGFREL